MKLNPDIKILVVDDSATMQAIFSKILNQIGFHAIVTARNGADALNRIGVEDPDLVISDWNMPVMDGIEFLKVLRSMPAYKKLPFIMVTAQADMEHKELVTAAGGSAHIAKPFDAGELKSAIQTAFGVKTQDTPSASTPEKRVNGKVTLTVSHIQITDHLVLGTLRHRIEKGEVIPEHFHLETRLFTNWNPIQEGLKTGETDCAFVLAPIAMDLFGHGTPIRSVLLAHRNGSSFIRSALYDPRFDSMQSFYRFKVVNIPHQLSVHHMLAHKYLKTLGLKPGVPGKKAHDVRFEVVPPVLMPDNIKANENCAGFIVAEPLAAKAVHEGSGRVQFYSGEQWEDHPCCIVVFQEDFIQHYPEVVQEFVTLLVDTGQLLGSDNEFAARAALKFLDPDGGLGLISELMMQVFLQPSAIRWDRLFPEADGLDEIQRYLHDVMGIGKLCNIENFIETAYADQAYFKAGSITQ